MKRRGFTLIELLAVIVILAIIALIAVPIVINIINDSKKESLQRSIDLYMDHAQKAITKYQMTHPDFNPKECTIEEKKLTCDGTEIEVEMKGQTPESGRITFNSNNKIAYNVILGDTEYTLDINGKKQNNPAPAKATADDYRGYYADIDGDGDPDGIIYADLNKSESGQWYDSKGTYTYNKATGELNEYTISKEKYTGEKAKFGEKEIIKLKKNKNNPRFYVMALEDFTTEAYTDPNDSNNNYPAYTTYFWYKNACNRMPNIVKDTSTDFGAGYTNTGTMIRIWNNNGAEEGWIQGATQYKQDVWKHIQEKYNSKEKWYIPSSSEWGAFGNYFTNNERVETKLTTSNYNSLYGLSSLYWSSSQIDSGGVLSAIFVGGLIDGYAVSSNYLHVRLGVTF